jgi:hypothetical protein
MCDQHVCIQDLTIGNLPSSSTTIRDTVGTSAMPCHADEQATVMAEIGRPVILAVGLGEKTTSMTSVASVRLSLPSTRAGPSSSPRSQGS